MDWIDIAVASVAALRIFAWLVEVWLDVDLNL